MSLQLLTEKPSLSNKEFKQPDSTEQWFMRTTSKRRDIIIVGTK